MSYDFSFEKKNTVLLAACILLIAMLLISAGYLLGIQHSSPHASISKPEPVLPILAPAVEKPVIRPAAPAKLLEVSPEPSSAANAGDLQADEPSPAPNHKSHPEPQFSLQIGAFHSKGNAEARVKALKEHGVAATIMSTKDAAGAPWFTVRAGTYFDLPSATKAARAMSAATSEFVIVRPGQSL
jgi:septal ring-binding cell division protein DamX